MKHNLDYFSAMAIAYHFEISQSQILKSAILKIRAYIKRQEKVKLLKKKV